MPLTKSDKNWIKKTSEEASKKAVEDNNTHIFGYLNTFFAKKDGLEDVKKEVKKIDKVLDMLDTILGNQVKDKQELDMVTARVSNHEQRIQKLEEK